MKKLKAAFYTLGCKVNQYETNGMIQEFMKAGYEIVEFDQIADVYIVNTCTVTNMADRKSRQMLRRVKELNSNAVLVAVGCYAQVAKEELEKISEIDLILGTNEKKNVIDYVKRMLTERKENNIKEREIQKLAINKEENNNENSEEQNMNIGNAKQAMLKHINVTDVLHCEEYADFGDVTFTEKTRAVIKVQDGCDRFCSYCIIPFARGHIRSRRPESVVSEITKIAKEGIKEVVITGIHLASYGRDFGQKDKQEILKNKNNLQQENKNEKMGKYKNIKSDIKNTEQYRLIDLLEEINKIDGIKRIRLRLTGANLDNRRIC